MSKKKQKSIDELITNSSIGHAMADIKKRGIDAHLKDLEHEMTPKRLRGKPKRSAATTKPKKDLASDHGSSRAKYGVSKIILGGKMSFVGANRNALPIFSEWWERLLKLVGDPLPNVELAHKAYMEGFMVRDYAAFLDDQRSSLDKAKQRAEHTCVMELSSRNCRACNAGVPHPHETSDDRLKISRKALIEKINDTARRLDRELAQLRQDLDRLRSFD